MGGFCITTAGQFSSFVKEVGTDSSGLGCWSWVYAGGGSKLTRIIVAYQPCGTRKRKTMGEAVWDQHLQYFKARGEIRNPRVMFQYNLISPLCRWKAARDKILLMGDFNKNVYSGPIAVALSEDESRLSKICHRTTGETFPPTHACSRTPIDAMFGTMGLVCTAAFMLPARAGVGNHQVFVADFTSESILRDLFPQWRRINWFTCKTCSSLTVAVKVPTHDRGHKKYKTKEGMFKVVTPILREWFHSALVAQCH